jgi:hypothetical protein
MYAVTARQPRPTCRLPLPPDQRAARRWKGGAVTAAVLGLMLPLARLEPSPTGRGTHRQWSMPSCGFLMRTGYPCPHCGMTTALSAAARGRWAAAWHAQPGGALIGAGILVAGLLGIAQGLSGRALLPGSAGWVRLVGGALVVSVLGWAVKLAAGLTAGMVPK